MQHLAGRQSPAATLITNTPALLHSLLHYSTQPIYNLESSIKEDVKKLRASKYMHPTTRLYGLVRVQHPKCIAAL